MEVAFKYQEEKIKIIKIQHRHAVMKSTSHVIDQGKLKNLKDFSFFFLLNSFHFRFLS